MRIGGWITVGAVTLGMATAAWAAITGKNGWTASTATTAAAIKANSTYVPGFGGTHWQDLASLELFLPSTSNQRDGVAADASGDLYVLVHGWTTDPQYTGLVRVSGSTVTTLVQDVMTRGNVYERSGTALEGVAVSPTTKGGLTAGHPVIWRWVDEIEGGNTRFPGHLDVVSVDPSSGAETFVHRFANLTNWPGAKGIDGSGTSTNGTIYVDLREGTLARLTWTGSAWVESRVPGSFAPGTPMRVGRDGMLYAMPGTPNGWNVGIALKNGNWPIYRMNPATGASSIWGSVEGKSGVMAWDFDANGVLWLGLRSLSSKNQAAPYYVARGVAGGVTSWASRISESNSPAYCVTGAGGTVYVGDSAAVYALQ